MTDAQQEDNTVTALVQREEPRVVQFAPVDPWVSTIAQIATDPNASMEKLERMLAMKERLDNERKEQAFAAAFAAAAAEFPHIPLNGTGDKNKRYALLKDILGLTRPVLSKHGLALNFNVETGDKVRVTARLSHREGHIQTTSIVLPTDTTGSKNAVQAVGSSQTYGQRYTAQAILGLSLGEDTDDDGAGAGVVDATITEEQFRELRDLLERSGRDEAKFVGFLRVASLPELPASRFADAKAALVKALTAKGAA